MPNINRPPITIEAHAYNFPAPRDLTPYLQSASLSLDTTSSGGGASFTLKIPFSDLGSVLPNPKTGWWIVVRDELKSALWWGRVSNVSAGRSVGGGGAPETVYSQPVSISAESYISVVNNAQIVLAAAGSILPFDGAVYNFSLWSKNLKAWMSAFKFKYPGGLLALLFLQLARTRLPATLGGQAIGEAVKVGWTTAEAAVDRADVQIDVPGTAINAIGAGMLPQGSVWGMLSGAFSADPTVVELFPSLDDAIFESPLSVALGGRQPFLNYRIKPLLTAPLATPEAIAGGVAVAFPSVLSAKPLNGVISFSPSWSDGDRVNGFFAQSAVRPGSQMAAFGLFGSPDFDYESIAFNGLRLYDLDWPFYPPDLEGAAASALPVKIDGLISLIKAITGDGELYARGSIQLKYTPSLMAGAWYAVDVREPLQVFRCYAQSVTHTIDVNPETRVITRRSSIQFERGHFFP